jgi:hypothetical protein
MRGYRWFAIAVFGMTCGLVVGCQSASTRRTVVTPEPTLSSTVESDGTVAEGTHLAPPVKTVSFVDRHPLFSKPRDYWDTSGDNKVVKAAAATFVGVPAGLYGEVKQIIVGAPADPRY